MAADGPGDDRETGPAAVHRVAWGLLLLAAVAYTGVPWEALLGFPLDPAEAFQSELAAVDQPTRWLFALTDGVAGVAAVVAALLLRRGRSGTDTLLERLVPVPVLLYGIGTIADVLSPLPCAPSVDAGCAEADGLASAGTAHSLTSLAATTGLVLLAAVIVGLLVGTRRRGVRVALAWWAPVVLYAATSLVSAGLSVADNLGVETVGTGWWQRAQTASASLCLAVVVPVLLRHRRAVRRPGVG
ncbi:DUF998 domain-containing protein [Cellulomonas triticagri]|uniref:DUF998 domain-containing protein n=1 Tax=Cellulomonas triticagri TaxID=2483352 RepID=A0A3M2J182_9CELL|nr:DUF998 domain-containing protein [Cellulomonas triticagri]RMI06554.1 DUF998 domain-containing protein [Cellulomonas triticagri]